MHETKTTSYNYCYILFEITMVYYYKRANDPSHAHTLTITALIISWYLIKFIFNLGTEVERHFVTVLL